jgi:bifunctional DNA-binding transcriptional regulator/antitoxin component of YhaV-PrlF toxin-antitoxin module
MTIIGMAKITSKGQVTLPVTVRRLLKLNKGQNVAFCIDKAGVILAKLKVSIDQTPYTSSEWSKIEQLAAAKGKIFDNSSDAKRHLREL